jgi:hypothetical protein
VKHVAALFHGLAAPFRVLMDPEGRRAWALMLMAGGGLSMTAFAAFALYLVRTIPKFAFYMGLASLFLIGIVITGYAALLGRKATIKGSVLGNTFEISDDQVQRIAEKVVEATPPPPPPPPAAPPVIIQTGPVTPAVPVAPSEETFSEPDPSRPPG